MPAKRRRPRGHIRELPSGSFQVIVYAGTDPLTKKSRYLRETLKTYGAAEVALTRRTMTAHHTPKRHGRANQEPHHSVGLLLSEVLPRQAASLC